MCKCYCNIHRMLTHSYTQLQTVQQQYNIYTKSCSSLCWHPGGAKLSNTMYRKRIFLQVNCSVQDHRGCIIFPANYVMGIKKHFL